MTMYINGSKIKFGRGTKTIKLANNIVKGRYIRAKKPIKDLIYNNTTTPQVSHYYYAGKQKVSLLPTIIPIYFTDWYQREYYYDDNSLKFNIRLDVDGNVSYINNVGAGDYDLSLGVLDVGEHNFSIEVEDVAHKTKSHRLFNKILIVDDGNDITEDETYNVTTADFVTHNITLNLDETATSEQLTNNRHGLTDLFAYYHNEGYRKIVLPENSYIRINMQIADETELDAFKKIIPKPVVVPTNTTIDLNGSTIKLHPYDDRDYGAKGTIYNNMIVFKECVDSHLINGIIEGDFFERKAINYNYNEGTEEAPKYKDGLSGSNGEHNGAITIYGGRYNTLENLTVQKVTGYNVMNEKGIGHANEKGEVKYVNASFWLNNGSYWTSGDRKDLVNGVEVPCNNRCISDYIDVSPLVALGGMSVGKMLSDYPTGHYYQSKACFYDVNKTFIEEFDVYHAREIQFPEGTKYVRFAMFTPLNGLNGESFWLLEPLFPEYIEYNNLTFIDNRTCVAPNRFKHFRMYKCNFIRSGQSITPLAIDAEDGGSTMQDLFIDSCEIIESAPSQTGDFVAVAGLNIVFENNINMGFGIRAEVVGATVRNNSVRFNSELGSGWRTNNTVRCYNNNFNGYTVNGYGHTKYKSQLCVKGANNLRGKNGWNKDNVDFFMYSDCSSVTLSVNEYYKNCTIPLDGYSYDGCSQCIFDNCTITCNTEEVKAFIIKSCSYGTLIDDIGEYNDCTFDVKNSTLKFFSPRQGAYIKGVFNNCEFNSPLTLQLLYTNNMGDIQFNNCTFTESLSIDLKESKVQFNRCTFNRGISYLNNGSINSEFNNCIGN